jgi:hypothetical protein
MVSISLSGINILTMMNKWLSLSNMKRVLAAVALGGIVGGIIWVGGLMALGTAFHADSIYFLRPTSGR